MSLVALDDMKTYLGIALVDTTYDVFLQSQLDIISASIEGYCGRKFLQATYTQTFEAQDIPTNTSVAELYMYHYPTISITSVKEKLDTDETIVTTYTNHSPSGKIYKVDSSNGRENWFQEYGNTSQVEIGYDAGYATTPLPIQDVVYSLVEQRYNKKVSGIAISFGDDVQRISIPGVMSIDFDYTLQANERKSAYGMILGNYSNVLDQYRSERAMIGTIRDNYVS